VTIPVGVSDVHDVLSQRDHITGSKTLTPHAKVDQAKGEAGDEHHLGKCPGHLREYQYTISPTIDARERKREIRREHVSRVPLFRPGKRSSVGVPSPESRVHR
jgi:hypothetical protein